MNVGADRFFKDYRRLMLAGALLPLIIAGCGGDSDDQIAPAPPAPPAAQTATGVFVDSVVQGLSYTSGGQNGITGADGSFTYEVGQSVTFEMGQVTLGSTTGKEIVTPLDLVADGASTDTAVQNRVRFLMLLDTDSNPANGITISEALRTRAASWPEVDFSTADLSAALDAIIPDTSVDGDIRQLPTAAAAQAHLEASVRCLYSGLFKGTYSGEDAGRWVLAISPQGFFGAAAAYSTAEEELIPLTFTSGNALQVQQNTGFIAGVGSTGSTFNGQFIDLNEVTGTWSEGSFSGARYAGSSAAAYKFLALLINNGTTVGLMQVDVAADDAITVTPAFLIVENQSLTATATLSGTALTGSISNEATFEGTLNKDTLILSGNWNHPSTSTSGTLISVGCRLR